MHKDMSKTKCWSPEDYKKKKTYGLDKYKLVLIVLFFL